MSSFEYIKIAWYYFSMWGKRLILFFLVLSIILAFFLHFLGQDKQALRTNKSIEKEQTKLLYTTLNDPKLQETKQGQVVAKIYSGFLCWSIGEVCTNNPADAPKYLSQSITAKIASLIVLPIVNPPASGIYWASDTLQNAGFIPKTYAAEGIGFAALKPIMNLWKVFRDISYMLLVLVLVIIGFMIMFRMKLNPQTVINVENALPKIVVAMILITFSFAIAGFMIDLMYVLIAIVISVVSSNGAFYDVGLMQNTYLNGNATSLWNSIFANPANINGAARGLDGNLGFLANWANLNWLGKSVIMNTLTALPSFVSGTLYGIVNFVIGYGITELLFGKLFDIFGKALNVIGGGTLVVGYLTQLLTFVATAQLSILIGFTIGPTIIVPIIAGALVFFTVLFLFFRIFLMLFHAYLQILFMIIVAPLILVFEAIPGKSTFSFWFKNLAAEVLTFPLVIGILTIGFVLSNQLSIEGNFWRPPFLNALDPNLLPIFIGMGVLFMTPNLIKLAKEQLFGVKGLPISFGLGTFFAGAGAGAGGALSLVGQISTASMGIQALTGKSIGNIIGTSHLPGPSHGVDQVVADALDPKKGGK